jgi:hypothetical protein
VLAAARIRVHVDRDGHRHYGGVGDRYHPNVSDDDTGAADYEHNRDNEHRRKRSAGETSRETTCRHEAASGHESAAQGATRRVSDTDDSAA